MALARLSNVRVIWMVDGIPTRMSGINIQSFGILGKPWFVNSIYLFSLTVHQFEERFSAPWRLKNVAAYREFDVTRQARKDMLTSIQWDRP